MSFNFIKLENRKYELMPSTSEPRGPLARHGGGGGGGGGNDAGAGNSRRKREGRMLREADRRGCRR